MRLKKVSFAVLILPAFVLTIVFLSGLFLSADAAEYPLLIKDAFGRKITIEKSPKRIVSLSPALTEILWAVGAGKRQVGRTDFCNYPPDCKNVTSVGGVMNFSMEHIVALKPDLVIIQRITPREVAERLTKLKITVVALDEPDSLSGVIDLITETGRILNAENIAKSVADEKRLVLGKALIRSNRFGNERLRVYFGGFTAPYITAGAGTFIDDLIWTAGGANIATIGKVAGRSPGSWPQLSPEEIAFADPQVVLAANVRDMGGKNPSDVLLKEAKANPVFAKTTAIKRGNICIINQDILLRPGPRLFDAMIELAEYLDEVQLD